MLYDIGNEDGEESTDSSSSFSSSESSPESSEHLHSFVRQFLDQKGVDNSRDRMYAGTGTAFAVDGAAADGGAQAQIPAEACPVY